MKTRTFVPFRRRPTLDTLDVGVSEYDVWLVSTPSGKVVARPGDAVHWTTDGSVWVTHPDSPR